MHVVFERAEPIADHITSFYFSAATKPHYVAGQFTELRIAHDNRDSRGDRRFYTLSSSPTEDLLAITTKFAPQNGSSFKAALQALQPGTELDMASPMGDFVLPKDQSIPLTFVAGGIGCTPFRSMLHFCRDSGEQRDITVIYGARSQSELAFQDEFQTLGAKFIALTGQPLDAATVTKHANPTGQIYLSGPEPMIESLQKDLRDTGVDRKRIQTDFFPGYTEA